MLPGVAFSNNSFSFNSGAKQFSPAPHCFSIFLAPFEIKAAAYTYHIWRLWYIGSYTIMAMPIKSLELHYPMIQVLIMSVFQ